MVLTDGKQTKSAGSTQKRLEEFRNYEKTLKNQPSNGKQEEPFVNNRHPKVLILLIFVGFNSRLFQTIL